MFKGKIRTLCGNEFTVFFLKDSSPVYNAPNDPLNSGAKLSMNNISDSVIDDPIFPDLNWMNANENSAGEGAGFFENN
tara:strand:+ start:182 stop:415 length:234 start_codon:yes stop_codon:yes gene_type:complete